MLEVLVCTIDNGILRAAEVPIAPRNDVRYLISWQQSGETVCEMPDSLRRSDVRVISLRGKGLSANRNHALLHAEGDLLLLADDDCRYQSEHFDTILQAFQRYPEADILTFMASDEDGKQIRPYPAFEYDYHERPYGAYVTSWEIVLRRSPRLPRFDERFGLGSVFLSCGEEEVFIHEAAQAGLQIRFIPEIVVQTRRDSTGNHFADSPGVRRAKGGVLYLMHGRLGAWLRCLKCALLHSHFQPKRFLCTFADLRAGIRYVRNTAIPSSCK